MRILALDTATAVTAVALVNTETGRELAARDIPAPRARPQHATALLGLVEAVMGRAGGGWSAIDRIAVGVGPGTFTGLRIGVAHAQGLARGRGLPLVPVSTLAALGRGAGSIGAGPDDAGIVPFAVIDARRGEAFAAVAGLLAPCVLGPEALSEAAVRIGEQGHRLTAIGDGAIQFRAVLEAAAVEVPPDEDPAHRVSAIHHAWIARDERPRDPHTIVPDYLRAPDAELKR